MRSSHILKTSRTRCSSGSDAAVLSSRQLPLLGRSLFVALCVLIAASDVQARNPNPPQSLQGPVTAFSRETFRPVAVKREDGAGLYSTVEAARPSLNGLYALMVWHQEAKAKIRPERTASHGDSRRFDRALATFRKRDFVSSAQQFASLHKDEPANVRIATLLGDCYVHLRRYVQAVSLLTPIEKAHPDNLDLEWALGMALVGAGQFNEGLMRVEKVAHQGNRAAAYLLAAEVYLKLTYYKKARHNAEAATRLDPKLPGVYTLSGIIDTFFGNKKEAVAEFEKALQADPNDAQAHLQLGVVLYTERRLGAAQRHLHRALVLNPKSFFARYELARVKRAQGNLQAAVKDLEIVESEEPQWLPAHVELAALYYLLKRPDDGATETKIVDRLMAEEQQRQSRKHTVSSQLPSP